MPFRYILILLFTSCTFVAKAQKPKWQWAAIGNNVNESTGMDIAVDAANNVYVTGSFTNTLILGTDTLTSAGLADVFVAKYNSSGHILWAKRAGGIWDDQGWAIAVDGSGNVYGGSMFTDTAVYGTKTLISKGSSDANLSKYDSNGNLVWTRAWGSIYGEHGMGITIGKNSKIYITGAFANGSPFGIHAAINFGAYTLTSYGYDDAYIVKIDSSGTIDWARQAGGESSDGGIRITVDKSGSIYMYGRATNTKMVFDHDTLYGKDIFLAKYDSSGKVSWIRGAVCNPSYETCLATDSYGNVYISGVANGSTTKPFNFGSIVLTGKDNSFLAKYDSSGNILWAKNTGVNKYGSAFDMVSDASGNLFVTGSINSWSIFGNDTIRGNGNEDIFVSKYDNNGNYLWAVNAGGDTIDAAYAIALDNTGNLLLTGNVSSTPAYFGANIISASNGRDMFVAKLSGVTGIERFTKMKNTIQLYPNPLNNEMVIEGAELNSTFMLLDVFGRVIYRGSINNAREHINTSLLTSGTYILQLTDAIGLREMYKLVKD